MTERITPTTWEQCARHVEAGGIAEAIEVIERMLK